MVESGTLGNPHSELPGLAYHFANSIYFMEEPVDPANVDLDGFQSAKAAAINGGLKRPPHVVWGDFRSGCGASIAIIPGVLRSHPGGMTVDIRFEAVRRSFGDGFFIRSPFYSLLPIPAMLMEKGLEPLLILEQLGNSHEFLESPARFARELSGLIKSTRELGAETRLFYTHGANTLHFEEALADSLGVGSIPRVEARAKPFNPLQAGQFIEGVYRMVGSLDTTMGYKDDTTLPEEEMPYLREVLINFLLDRNIPLHLKVLRKLVQTTRSVYENQKYRNKLPDLDEALDISMQSVLTDYRLHAIT